MKRTSLWLVIAAALIIALLFYRSRRTNLNVEPHAGEVIEKAKQR